MLPISKLPVDVKGLTDEMKVELEERILEFEREYEPLASVGGPGYVPKISKTDFIVAGIINGAILIYWIFAVLLAPM